MSDGVQHVLITVGFAAMLIAMYFGKALRNDNTRAVRRIYWTGWCVGIPIFVVGMQTTVLKTFVSLIFWAVLAVGLAYVATPYLTIKGRTYALLRQYRQPEPDPHEQ
jgi:hypothetical protein